MIRHVDVVKFILRLRKMERVPMCGTCLPIGGPGQESDGGERDAAVGATGDAVGQDHDERHGQRDQA